MANDSVSGVCDTSEEPTAGLLVLRESLPHPMGTAGLWFLHWVGSGRQENKPFRDVSTAGNSRGFNPLWSVRL